MTAAPRDTSTFLSASVSEAAPVGTGGRGARGVACLAQGAPVCAFPLQCAAAALWGPCPRAATRWAAARAGRSSMALTVTDAARATTVIPIATVSRGPGRGWAEWEGPPQAPRA